MREKSGKDVQIKAAGGVRTLDDLLHVMSLGVTRIGATATVAILEEAKKRGKKKQRTTKNTTNNTNQTNQDSRLFHARLAPKSCRY